MDSSIDRIQSLGLLGSNSIEAMGRSINPGSAEVCTSDMAGKSGARNVDSDCKVMIGERTGLEL